MAATPTLHDIIHIFRSQLSDIYPDNEIRNFCMLAAEHLLNYSKIDFHLKTNEPISQDKAQKFNEIIFRLKKWEPIQYIIGYTEFYGLKFKVDSRALIPRPETEELVDWIVKEEKDCSLEILDIGTGSGCIAITLARFLKKAHVSGCDMTKGALELAAENASLNRVNLNFFQIDILNRHLSLPQQFDIIVSNPPYVRDLEKSYMRRNVLDYEPDLALFVPDEDPLIFYRRIAELGKLFLREGGRLYFEINESLSDELRKMLNTKVFRQNELRNDINGKPRMIMAVK